MGLFPFRDRVRNYVRSEFTGTLAIKSGHHPILETLQSVGTLIPNDVYSDDSSSFQIIQGPKKEHVSTLSRPSRCAVASFLQSMPAFADDVEKNLSTFASEMTTSAKIFGNQCFSSSTAGLELARLANLPSDVLVEANRVSKHLTKLQTEDKQQSDSAKIAIRRKALLKLRTNLTQALEHSALPDEELLAIPTRSTTTPIRREASFTSDRRTCTLNRVKRGAASESALEVASTFFPISSSRCVINLLCSVLAAWLNCRITPLQSGFPRLHTIPSFPDEKTVELEPALILKMIYSWRERVVGQRAMLSQRRARLRGHPALGDHHKIRMPGFVDRRMYPPPPQTLTDLAIDIQGPLSNLVADVEVLGADGTAKRHLSSRERINLGTLIEIGLSLVHIVTSVIVTGSNPKRYSPTYHLSTRDLPPPVPSRLVSLPLCPTVRTLVV
ncbi:hypothetical protein BT96DRAFT_1008624 [Gymnopus androsaceus JB14]|uniref:Uncharacterized protein n=1 Tax=Gymnopus androsaceus JB14 TaxID=1447944 RepID=A0A6A4GEE8_9AGAR|nr:hypothetical protein BT96DRAFT_1008624 [Gymnopus androsaceus JB14]